jgi:DNA polymerase-3 subunit epsilon
MLRSFAAIDFETADHQRDSACAVGIVRVDGGSIVDRYFRLIKPPRRNMVFTWVHGITWEMVCDEAPFVDVWREGRQLLCGVEVIAAHNASFDQSVLAACCRRARLPEPEVPFICSMMLARRHLGIRPTTLPDVCRELKIPLRHHDALSDAEACAAIVLALDRY